MEKITVGILYICTGNYKIFWKDFYESMEQHFLTDYEKQYFVFTDSEEIDFAKDNPRIHRIHQPNIGWPDNTLMRFHIFLRIEQELRKLDYLYFCNANLQIMQDIRAEDVLPSETERLTAVLHPGFFTKDRSLFTYDNNPKSTAYIPDNEGTRYYAGGFNGGISSDFIAAMKTMRDNIDTDKRNGVIARWHDESHWNRYLVHMPNIKKLSPAYLYPEGWNIPCTPRILVRDKNRHGGHDALRNSKQHNSIIKRVIGKVRTLFVSSKKQNVQFTTLPQFELNNTNLLIATIAFNNLAILKAQHHYLKTFLDEDYVYMIADNSSDEAASIAIADFCIEQHIPYIKIPKNPFLGNPSKSHGFALNWTFANIIRKYQTRHFGFIDHDILPFRTTTITDKIKQGIFGLTQQREERWYLWPGLSFYTFDSAAQLNFMPCSGLDTGGSNYDILYKNLNRDTLGPALQYYYDINLEKKVPAFVQHNDAIVETIGDWLHLMRTSNWHKASEAATPSIKPTDKSALEKSSIEKIITIVNENK